MDKAVPDCDVVKMLEDYNQNLISSGYSLSRRQEIFKAGLLGYKRKGSRTLAESGYTRHKSGRAGMHRRRLLKLADKARWYKKKGKGDMRDESRHIGSTYKAEKELSNVTSSTRPCNTPDFTDNLKPDLDLNTNTTKPTTTTKKSQDPIAVLFVQRTVGG